MAQREDLNSGPAEEASANETDPTLAARQSLAAIEAKLQRADGWEGLVAWLEQVERALAAIQVEDIERTRSEIRRLIDELLNLNAQIQNILRLKKLFAE